MKRVLVLLILLLLIGILGRRSRFWEFDEEGYLGEDIIRSSHEVNIEINLDYLKRVI